MRMRCDIMQKRWRVMKPAEADVQKLIQQLHISEFLARVLLNRNISSPEEARRFLCDALSDGYDPFLMKDMDKAVKRISKSIDAGENIIIYGDYDVDGITSTSLLYMVLTDLGAMPSFYIPERQNEGYGLNEEALNQLTARQTDLVITVDCGISSYELIEEYKTKLDIIVTDHHEPPSQIPNAYAVLNPKQKDCSYPFRELAGAGVAYKLCQALWTYRKKEPLTSYTEIAALGTIADLVPLRDENRLLVQRGLKKMKEGCNTGLQALLDASSLDKHTISVGRIAFTAAPRLNAAGRISHAEQGVRLLLESDSEKAKRMAHALSELNRERQEIEHTIAEQAIKQIEKEGRGRDGVLVAFGTEWHVGVIGIAASRLVEKYYRPSLVISVHNGIGKGSCRSIAGFNMYEALQYADDLLLQYGGHPMAAGFSIQADKIEAFRQRLNEYAVKTMRQEDYIPVVMIDAVLQGMDISLDLIRELSCMEPYGMGNSRPVFSMSMCRVEEIRPIGKDKQHVRFMLTCDGIHKIHGVGWSMASLCESVLEGDLVDVAFQLERNDFNGMSFPQLVLQDVHLPEQSIHLDRTRMIDIYLALKKIIPEWGMPIWQTQQRIIAAESDTYTAHDIYAAIQVLKEIGVLRICQHADGPAYYFPTLSGKMCLDMSETYQKYSQH